MSKNNDKYYSGLLKNELDIAYNKGRIEEKRRISNIISEVELLAYLNLGNTNSPQLNYVHDNVKEYLDLITKRINERGKK